MHLLRRALRIAGAQKTTVPEVATNYGFWELGRCAVAYRSLSGEPPSGHCVDPPEDIKLAEIIEPAWKFVKSAFAPRSGDLPSFFAKMLGRHCAADPDVKILGRVNQAADGAAWDGLPLPWLGRTHRTRHPTS
jgi:hypothetical protein